MKSILIALVSLSWVSANAGIFCHQYSVSGDLEISSLCAMENPKGLFKTPVLLAKNGINWPISTGFITGKRAGGLCRSLGMTVAVSYKITACPEEQAALNLKGNYDSSSFTNYGTGKCIDQVKCK